MIFEPALIKGTLTKRYKRFLADVTLESGEEITAHCANTGSMTSCWQEGDTVYLSYHDNPKRKLKYTWELNQVDGGFIGINTALPNHIVSEGVSGGLIPELEGYKSLRNEVKYGNKSRIDILLEDHKDESAKPRCWVEVKNVTLYNASENRVEFPDAVTARGLKHLIDLSEQVRLGDRAVMFYLVNRPEGNYFSPAGDIDSAYAEGLNKAIAAGVEVLCYRTSSNTQQISIGKPVRIII